MNIGIITGSGFYDFEEISGKKDLIIETAEGAVSLAQSQFNRHNFFFIARHGKSHEFLPNMINYKANILALRETGVNLIIATSGCHLTDHHVIDRQVTQAVEVDLAELADGILRGIGTQRKPAAAAQVGRDDSGHVFRRGSLADKRHDRYRDGAFHPLGNLDRQLFGKRHAGDQSQLA